MIKYISLSVNTCSQTQSHQTPAVTNWQNHFKSTRFQLYSSEKKVFLRQTDRLWIYDECCCWVAKCENEVLKPRDNTKHNPSVNLIFVCFCTLCCSVLKDKNEDTNPVYVLDADLYGTGSWHHSFINPTLNHRVTWTLVKGPPEPDHSLLDPMFRTEPDSRHIFDRSALLEHVWASWLHHARARQRWRTGFSKLFLFVLFLIHHVILTHHS